LNYTLRDRDFITALRKRFDDRKQSSMEMCQQRVDDGADSELVSALSEEVSWLHDIVQAIDKHLAVSVN
jgi:hypothetical protein